ncbi:hypothetical protein GOM49_00240 [Clostridium bovifaecis]|uniref:Lipoprotein n=1 Tax=Clostridium bovifaecis TaxID=2184719 RepID=A0A6I6EJF2_9CLOT|nr:hypothetical protein GOM49_00240 [Clostridium bovifaecis]
MKKRLKAISFILITIVIFTGCGIKNPFKKDTKNVSTTSEDQKTSEENKDSSVSGSFLGSKELESKYNLKRKNLDNARTTENLKDLKEFDDAVSLNTNSMKKSYDDKITTRNNAIQDKIKKELDIELQRVKAEFENAKNKVQAEYASEKSKNIASAEKDREDKLLKAEKENAEKERIVNDKYAIKIEVQSKAYENEKLILSNLWNEYDRKIKIAQQERDNNKITFKNKIIKEYNNKLKKLSEDKITTESIWENAVLNENKEILEFYKSEDEEYKTNVKSIMSWRDNEFSKIT